jgi:hypothetical protein
MFVSRPVKADSSIVCTTTPACGPGPMDCASSLPCSQYFCSRYSMLPLNGRYGVQPLRWVHSVRNLPVQRRYRGRLYLLRIEQFHTIGCAKSCGEINKAIALRSRNRRGRPPDQCCGSPLSSCGLPKFSVFAEIFVMRVGESEGTPSYPQWNT